MYSDAVIGARITTIFDDELGLYGAQRIAASLNEDTAYTPVNHKKVARIIKSHGTSMALPSAADASLPGVSLATASCQIY
ncbi:transposase [Corynebacterium rhinophilum]|uniref:transposase n=1 Tax=Corynebacterium rhinophilum TaxID=3050197 RepID=UPI00254DE34D|nr:MULTISPECIES: transposase [unclassified Corynebacterium]MDK8492786.1 transposase [Corynebacterium sp. MSK175]MDK8648789.1 transposase [Corynebacterium sp. MSK082]MDK8699208.1 transposase [Corynebacterium sp. MSK192]MDK8787500.1 transposase [Corynebacterium sp. MSK156]